MRQDEHEELQDGPEFEITNLDEADGDAPTAAWLPDKPVLFLRKHRRGATLASLAFVVLGLLLILLSVAPVRQLFTPPVVQNTFAYRLDANPPWGRLFVDGQPAKLTSGGFYPLFSLTRGEHTLLWRADPFSPQRCMLTVPVGSGGDSCKHPDVPPVSGKTGWYISFPTDFTTLSPGQRAALLQATQAVFDSQQSSEMVRAGELYAQTAETSGLASPSCTVLQIAALCLANAQQPLKATLRLQLDSSSWSRASCANGACASNGQNCHLFCDPFVYALPDMPASARLWQAFVYVQLFWQFATLDGRVIADNQADTFIRGQQNDIAVALKIAWDGQRWGVSIVRSEKYAYASDPVCDAAMHDVYNLENAVPATTSQDVFTSMDAIHGTTYAAGCLIAFNLRTGVDSSATPTTPPLVAYVMQRFGVLLAVNSEAHTLFPFLPVASAYEKQLAQQWTTPQPGGWNGQFVLSRGHGFMLASVAGPESR